MEKTIKFVGQCLSPFDFHLQESLFGEREAYISKVLSKLTGIKNCSIFNKLKGLRYRRLSPFYVVEGCPIGR
jgi:hypothetical protein